MIATPGRCTTCGCHPNEEIEELSFRNHSHGKTTELAIKTYEWLTKKDEDNLAIFANGKWHCFKRERAAEEEMGRRG